MSVKSLTAALALASTVGMVACGSDGPTGPEQPEQSQEFFDPNTPAQFFSESCTNDDYTLATVLTGFPSLSDLDSIARATEQPVDSVAAAFLLAGDSIYDASMDAITEKYQLSDIYPTNTADSTFVAELLASVPVVFKQIEEETSVTMYPGDDGWGLGLQSDAEPEAGCSVTNDGPSAVSAQENSRSLGKTVNPALVFKN